MSSTHGESPDAHAHHSSYDLPMIFTNYIRDDLQPSSDSIDVIAHQLEGCCATDDVEVHSLLSNQASIPGSRTTEGHTASPEKFVGTSKIIHCPSAYLYMLGGTNSIDPRDSSFIHLPISIHEDPDIVASIISDAHVESSDNSASPRDSIGTTLTHQKAVDMSLNIARWRSEPAFRLARRWQTSVHGRLSNLAQGVIIAHNHFEDPKPALENYSPIHRWQFEAPNEQPWAGIWEVAEATDDIAHSAGFDFALRSSI